VIVIISILASMMIVVTGRSRDHAELVQCTANLRALHAALNSYVADHGQWPQMPEEMALGSGDTTDRWWMEQLKEYSMALVNWKCPTISRLEEESKMDPRERTTIHYTPVRFDRNRLTPYKWPKMPWAIEIGDAHGKGNLCVFPDGSVKPMNEVVAEQTGQEWQ